MEASEVKIEAKLVEAIARRVVELLRAEAREQPSLVDAATLARDLGVERDWVYSHANDLGAIRLGGPRGRLRFDRKIARERLEAAKGVPRLGRGRRAPVRTAKHRKSESLPHDARVKSPRTQRRASGWTPARSPRQNQPGGNPDDDA